jgi:hypothetical protein
MLELLVLFVILIQILTGLVGFRAYFSLSQNLTDSEARLNALKQSPAIDLDGVVDDLSAVMQNIVADTLQNLEPPRAIDHVFGAVAQMIQARTMSMMQLPTGLNEVVDTVKDHLMPDEQDNV